MFWPAPAASPLPAQAGPWHVPPLPPTEYSSACICEVMRKSPIGRDSVLLSTGSPGGAVAVVAAMQMRREAAGAGASASTGALTVVRAAAVLVAVLKLDPD